MSTPPPNTFPHTKRLHGRLTFSSIFDNGLRHSSHPLLAITTPNTLPHHRLGISIGRKVGSAPVRNRIKRLLRESFRLLHDNSSFHYDLILVVRPHTPLTLPQYQSLLSTLLQKSHTTWQQRTPQ